MDLPRAGSGTKATGRHGKNHYSGTQMTQLRNNMLNVARRQIGETLNKCAEKSVAKRGGSKVNDAKNILVSRFLGFCRKVNDAKISLGLRPTSEYSGILRICEY